MWSSIAVARSRRRPEGRALRVALVVDADDAELAAIVAALDPDWLQLHGSRDARRACAAIRARFGRPVMKAIGVAEAADLAATRASIAAAPIALLLDAKPPRTRGRAPRRQRRCLRLAAPRRA